MGFVPPPIPPSRELFAARWKAGARTIRELDPEFAAWMDGASKLREYTRAAITLGVVVLIFVGLMILMRPPR